MKNLILILLFCFFICSILFNACKKYENDEALVHLRSVKKRVINKWKFDSAFLHDTDISDTINLGVPNLWFDYKFNMAYYSYAYNDSLVSFGTWHISNYGATLARFPNPGGVVENLITRLDRDHMWLKAYVLDWNDTVEYRFTRKD